jgi:hypothetical protein
VNIESLTAACISFSIFASLSLVVGGLVNRRWLPTATAWESLAFDAIFVLVSLGGVLLLKVAINRALRGRLAHKDLWMGEKRVIAVFLAVLVLSAPVAMAPRGEPAKRAGAQLGAKARYVFVLVCDSLRADHLSLYGYQDATDVRLRAFAESRGVTFKNATSQSSWTKPAVATILTSLYPSAHTAVRAESVLPEAVVTVAEVLQGRGFRTAAFSANEWISPLFGFGQGMDRFVAKSAPRINKLAAGHLLEIASGLGLKRSYARLLAFDRWLVAGGRTEGASSAEQLTHEVLDWVHQNKSTSLFAYVHYMEPHTPYSPPPAYMDGETVAPSGMEPPYFGGLEPFERAAPLSEGEVAALKSLYDGEIRVFDHWFGRLVEGLDAAGILGETPRTMGRNSTNMGGGITDTLCMRKSCAFRLLSNCPEVTGARCKPRSYGTLTSCRLSSMC